LSGNNHCKNSDLHSAVSNARYENKYLCDQVIILKAWIWGFFF